ncbi:MAG: hypothetical protein ACLQUY_00730 [Ktedonobacterales bacterium]
MQTRPALRRGRRTLPYALAHCLALGIEQLDDRRAISHPLRHICAKQQGGGSDRDNCLPRRTAYVAGGHSPIQVEELL